MVKKSGTRVASVSDVQRAVAKALVSQAPKKQRRAKQNNGGSSAAPVAVGATLTNRGPSYGSGNSGNSRIRNTEFVTDLLTTGPTTIQGFDLNPNSSPLFTWLARIASGYELFRFHSLRFTYTPLCPTSTTGVVVMAFDYDASDGAPGNKQTITAYSGSRRTNAWAPLTCDLKPPAGWFYVGQGTGTINPTGTDIKFYDVARFYIGMFNTGTNIPLGELSVTYDVEFSKPDLLGSAIVQSELVYPFTGSSVSSLVGTPTMTGNVPVSLASNGTGSYTMTFGSPGRYMIEQVAQLILNSNGSSFNQFVQTDPGAAPITLNWADSLTTAWTSATTLLSTIHMVVVSVLAGTVITVTVTGNVNSGNLFRLRFMPYTLT